MSTDFTPTRLAADREIINAATPGPWEAVTRGNTIKSNAVTAVDKYISIASGISPRTGDAAFIAAARTGWPEALDEVERLQKQIDRIQTLLDEADARRGCCKNHAELAVSNGIALGRIAATIEHVWPDAPKGEAHAG